MIINCFENDTINENMLPSEWKNSLGDFNDYLQQCWNQRASLFDDKDSSNKQQFIDFDHSDGFKTRKYIGSIRYKNNQINIFPKVFKVDRTTKPTDADYTIMVKSLLIWISYCDRKIFPYINDRSNFQDTNSLKELFIMLYSKYVLQTINKQLFFRYEDKIESGSFIKGKIDFHDYILNKYTSGNKQIMNYSFSDFVFDNKVNRIIKYVCKSLLFATEEKNSRINLQNIIMKLTDVADEKCVPSDCDNLHLEGNQIYSTIISLSKMFLLNMVSENDFGTSDTFCFLFPSDLLFEQFVAGFAKESLEKIQHVANVKSQTSDTYISSLVINGAEVRRIYLKEDILINKNGVLYVFDTKYKYIPKFNEIISDPYRYITDNDDIRQMAIYALQRNAKRLCLIYPLYKNEIEQDIEIKHDIKPFPDKSITYPCYIVKIPFIFDSDEHIIKERINNILNKLII